MLRTNLDAGIPAMVEWMDWGGHWVVVTGYDPRGTETVWDDVIIDAMWFDARYFPSTMRDRAWVVAVPGR